jgi:hypothetical protein
LPAPSRVRDCVLLLSSNDAIHRIDVARATPSA